MILKIKKVCILLLSCVLFLNFSCDSISQNEKSDKTNESEIPPSPLSEFEIYSYGRDSSVFFLNRGSRISESSPYNLVRIRSTFPSTAGTGISYAIDATAPAV